MPHFSANWSGVFYWVKSIPIVSVLLQKSGCYKDFFPKLGSPTKRKPGASLGSSARFTKVKRSHSYPDRSLSPSSWPPQGNGPGLTERGAVLRRPGGAPGPLAPIFASIPRTLFEDGRWPRLHEHPGTSGLILEHPSIGSKPFRFD